LPYRGVEPGSEVKAVSQKQTKRTKKPMSGILPRQTGKLNVPDTDPKSLASLIGASDGSRLREPAQTEPKP
jgi:hypothetical protein